MSAYFYKQVFFISIHAPREGGDLHNTQAAELVLDFNPRPPRGGRRSMPIVISATSDFNPRPPRGGRHAVLFPYKHAA